MTRQMRWMCWIGLVLAATAGARGQATSRPAGCVEWEQTKFVHPPLNCMRACTRIDEYPISAWCFHGTKAGRSPYNEEYVRNAKAIGFNVLIDAVDILPFAEKVGGVKVQLAQLWENPAKLRQKVFDNPAVGDHPLVQGIVIGDNGGGFGKLQIETAQWLKQNYPHLPAIMSQYPCRMRADTPMRIWHMQNYPFMPGRSRNPPTHYVTILNNDRLSCNANDMALFECYAGDVSFSRVQFQIMAAMAYGAQGLSNFCYSPHRMAGYKPDSPLVPLWFKMHRYAIDVLGRHLWGTRSYDVLHSSAGGRHPDASNYDASQPVVRATDDTLVGLLTPEKRFLAKDTAVPEYLLFVDKRQGATTPEARDSYLMLRENIPAVELLDPEATVDAKIRKIVPGFKVRMKIEGSDARLLRVAPDLEALLGGPEGLKAYDRANKALLALQWQATPPARKGQPTDQASLTAKPVADAEIRAAVDAAKAAAAEVGRALDAAVRAGTISADQKADTLQRLADSIAAAASDAKAPSTDK